MLVDYRTPEPILYDRTLYVTSVDSEYVTVSVHQGPVMDSLVYDAYVSSTLNTKTGC